MRPAKYALPLLFFSLLAYFLVEIRAVLLPFILGAVLAYLASPLIGALEIRGYHRMKVVGVLFAFTLLVIGLGGWAASVKLSEQVDTVRASYPQYLRDIDHQLEKVHHALRKIPGAEAALNKGEERLRGAVIELASKAPDLLSGLLSLLEYLFLVPFISFFFMVGGPALLNWLLDLCPSRYVEMALNIVSEIDESLGNYLRGILIEAAACAALAFLGLLAAGINYPFQLAVLVGVSGLVPYLGAAIGALAGSVVALIQFKSFAGVLRVLLVFGAVRFADDWVFQPIILKNAVEMHPVIILFSIMAGHELAGFLGIVFAVPVACMIKVVMEVGWDWYRTEFSIKPPAEPPSIERVPVV